MVGSDPQERGEGGFDTMVVLLGIVTLIGHFT